MKKGERKEWWERRRNKGMQDSYSIWNKRKFFLLQKITRSHTTSINRRSKEMLRIKASPQFFHNSNL